MKLSKISMIMVIVIFFAIPAILVSGCNGTPTASPVTGYLIMNPPPDSDKPLPVPAGDKSCWMHSAANLLAVAGYGNGTTVQARADDIFADMNAQYGTANPGWPSAALQWWLASANNTWTTNPYTVVTLVGNTNCTPWANANGARVIGNELRLANPVSVAIRWPLNGPGCSGGHAITAVGDNDTSITALTNNPAQVQITDSDTDNGGNIQNYTFDAYTNPNPGGANEGNGWYINYGNNHPYFIDIVTLSPTTTGTGTSTVHVVGSYKIQQTSAKAADDLHYKVGTDVDILSYRTWLDWPGTPTITENQPIRELTVDWDLSEKPVPQNTWVVISTEFIESTYNSIYYKDVYFTYPTGDMYKLPNMSWVIDTPIIDNAERIPNVIGGYVIGRFDVFGPDETDEPVLQYRFIHEYLYNQKPEFHTFRIIGDEGYEVANIQFGHSYGYISEKELWEFEDWMNKESEIYKLGEEPITIEINWEGQLPYPEGLE
jgi:hypothetical protein